MENLFSFVFITDFPTSGLREEASRVDIVGRLPPEIASQILRLLEGPSLVAAAGVSRLWLARCRADPELRLRVRRQLFYEGRGALLGLQGAVRSVPDRHPDRAHAFARVNAHARRLHAAADPDPVRSMEEDRFFAQCGPPRSSARLPGSVDVAEEFVGQVLEGSVDQLEETLGLGAN
ncbi:Uncharacterized protein GBIM_12026 [Gryllus bimaculatus]|nr:Uncharacterized protein GBIM_12026 [Gryllus bimaculatus]